MPTVKGIITDRVNPFAWMNKLKDNDIGVFPIDGAPSNGTSGTGFGVLGPGCLLIDYTNANIYINSNTKASPTWTLLVRGDTPADLALAQGNIFVGNGSGLAAAVSAKTNAQILVGDGTTVNSVAVSGDITVDNTGATAIGVGKVTSSMILNNTIVSADIATSVIQVATGSISSANITGTSAGQLGHANGVVLLAAAAAGSINQLISAVFAMDYATAAYTGGGNTTVNISGGGAALTGLVSNANFIQVSSDKIIEFVPLAATFNNYGTGANGLALVTASAPTQPGTAAGIINWAIAYRVIPSLLD